MVVESTTAKSSQLLSDVMKKKNTTKPQSSYTDEVSGKEIPEWKVQSNSSHVLIHRKRLDQRQNSDVIHCFGA